MAVYVFVGSAHTSKFSKLYEITFENRKPYVKEDIWRCVWSLQSALGWCGNYDSIH